MNSEVQGGEKFSSLASYTDYKEEQKYGNLYEGSPPEYRYLA